MLLGGAAALWAPGCSRAQAPPPASADGRSCVLTPELDEGPYFLDDARFRSDIREGKPGVPLVLVLALIEARTCRPVPNAAVDLWHCDGGGLYSGFTSESAQLRPPDARDGPPFPGPPDGRRATAPSNA